MNRADFQLLANDRLADTKLLLRGKRWAAAYYLAGYAMECGLKSCIIAYLMRADQFPEKKFSEQCWTHNLTQLMGLAGLHAELEAAMVVDPDLRANWDIVKDWSEASRYDRTTKTWAEDLYAAITDKKHGVFPWIKDRW